VTIIRWAEHAACIWKSEMHAIFWSENLRGGFHFVDLGVDKCTSKWLLDKCGKKMWIGLN
jgi:hypothetical protein